MGGEKDFQFGPAGAGDYPWIFEGMAEAVWVSLTPHRQEQIAREEVFRHHRKHAMGFAGHEDFPNLAIIARDREGNRAGFVWVAEYSMDGAGKPHGCVMDIFVAPACRRRGLARRLMAEAENWCRSRGLKYLLLSVAPHNQAARELYRAEGYEVERLIMSKDL